MKCKHCGEFVKVEKTAINKFQEKWQKTFLISTGVFFTALLLIYNFEGSLESNTVRSIIISLIVASIGGGLIAYFKSGVRRKRIENYKKREEVKEKNGVWLLLVGVLLIFLNISRGGGFTSSDSPEAAGYNMTSFIIWIISIALVIKGIKRIRKNRSTIIHE